MGRKIVVGISTFAVSLFFLFMLVFILQSEQKGVLTEPTEYLPQRGEDIFTLESEKNKQTTKAHIPELETKVPVKPNMQTEKFDASKFFKGVTTSKIFNNELQIYLLSQTQIEKNKINIYAEKIGNRYISGKVESKTAFRYGDFRFKISMMDGKGYFPAIWLMPENGELFPEIDIFEQIGRDPRHIHGVVHYIKNTKQLKHNHLHTINDKKLPQSIILDFKWTKDSITWIVDGKYKYILRQDIPQIPVYMIINLAIGGDWPQNPDKNTKFPANFNVEIIKFNPKEIYER